MTRELAEKFPHLEFPVIWLDYWDYTQELLLKGQPIEWLAPAKFDEYYRQTLGLFEPGIAPIDLDRLIEAYVERNPIILKAMTYRKRPTYPLKALLGDAGLRSAAVQLCETTGHARKRRPLGLTVSAPLALLNRAHSLVHGAPISAIGEDDCERAAVYLTDFLGSLRQPQGTFILLVDHRSEAADARYRDAMRPLSNLAAHMRWHLALATQAAIKDPMGGDLVFTPDGLDGVWMQFPGERRATAAVYAQIPANITPEKVLKEVAALRGRA